MTAEQRGLAVIVAADVVGYWRLKASVQRECFEMELTRYTGATAGDGSKE